MKRSKFWQKYYGWIGNCKNDNFWCSRWRQFYENDNVSVLVWCRYCWSNLKLPGMGQTLIKFYWSVLICTNNTVTMLAGDQYSIMKFIVYVRDREMWRNMFGNIDTDILQADSRFAPSQWETSLQSNTVSHWLDANLELALYYTQVPPDFFRSRRPFWMMSRGQ